jgi:simple sugar transport system ATP-binding protein
MTGEIAALRDKGAAVILISTNLDEILSLADRIIVMYRGRIAGEVVNAENAPVNGASVKEEIGRFMQGITGEMR